MLVVRDVVEGSVGMSESSSSGFGSGLEFGYGWRKETGVVVVGVVWFRNLTREGGETEMLGRESLGIELMSWFSVAERVASGC